MGLQGAEGTALVRNGAFPLWLGQGLHRDIWASGSISGTWVDHPDSYRAQGCGVSSEERMDRHPEGVRSLVSSQQRFLLW